MLYIYIYIYYNKFWQKFSWHGLPVTFFYFIFQFFDKLLHIQIWILIKLSEAHILLWFCSSNFEHLSHYQEYDVVSRPGGVSCILECCGMLQFKFFHSFYSKQNNKVTKMQERMKKENTVREVSKRSRMKRTKHNNWHCI